MPKLYGLASNKKVKTIIYKIYSYPDSTASIHTIHGYVDGKQQTDIKYIKIGKNLGRSNETTPEQQAILETESKYKKKLDNNYTTNTTGIPDLKDQKLLPMLAHTYQKRKHNIVFPCLVQPKLNGLRLMSKENKDDPFAIETTSRKFKPYTTLMHLHKDIKELIDVLPKISSKIITDGEIYKHNLTLQEINRRVKKYRGQDTEELEYWVYDIADTTLTNEERDELLQQAKIALSENSKVKILETYVAFNEAEIHAYHDKFVKLGYEGVIIRNKQGKYLMEKRSPDLQKYKEFLDDEFTIIGTKEGTGREAGAIIFTCLSNVPNAVGAKTQKPFDVRPKGSIESRIELMKKAYTFINKKLTVKYQDLTEDGIPSFPVGITIRLEEDLP